MRRPLSQRNVPALGVAAHSDQSCRRGIMGSREPGRIPLGNQREWKQKSCGVPAGVKIHFTAMQCCHFCGYSGKIKNPPATDINSHSHDKLKVQASAMNLSVN